REPLAGLPPALEGRAADRQHGLALEDAEALAAVPRVPDPPHDEILRRPPEATREIFALPRFGANLHARQTGSERTWASGSRSWARAPSAAMRARTWRAPAK